MADDDKKPAKMKGRPKGTGGKPQAPRRSLLTVRATLTDMRYDPIREYVRLLEQLEDPLEKLRAIQALLPYFLPKMKEVEPPSEDYINETTIDVTPMSDEELMQKLKEDDEQ